MTALDFKMPEGWSAMDDRQLRYVFRLTAEGYSADEVKILSLLKFSRCEIIGRNEDKWLVRQNKKLYELQTIQFAEFMPQLQWLVEIPQLPVRIASFRGHKATDSTMQGSQLKDYLIVENLYQGFLSTQNNDFLRQIAQVLYKKKSKLTPDFKHLPDWFILSVFYWVTSLKSYLANMFPEFFKPIAPESSGALASPNTADSVREAMDAQIRALTKGDITKEEEILSSDTWRALTELNAQAREYAELKAQTKATSK